jgi:hypothetical protein
MLTAKRKARFSIILGTSLMLAFGSAFSMSRKAPLEDIDYGSAPIVAAKGKTADNGSASYTDSVFAKAGISGKSVNAVDAKKNVEWLVSNNTDNHAIGILLLRYFEKNGVNKRSVLALSDAIGKIKSKGTKSVTPQAFKAYAFKAKKASKKKTDKGFAPFVAAPPDVLSVSQEAINSGTNAKTTLTTQPKTTKAKTAISKNNAAVAKAKTDATAKSKTAVAKTKSKQATKGKTAVVKAKSKQTAAKAVAVASQHKSVKNAAHQKKAAVKAGSKSKSKSAAIVKSKTKAQKQKAIASIHNKKKTTAAKASVVKADSKKANAAIAASPAKKDKADIASASKPTIKTGKAAIGKIKAQMAAEKKRHIMKAVGLILAGLSASFFAGWALSGRLSRLVKGFRRKIALMRARNIVMSYAPTGQEKPRLTLLGVAEKAMAIARARASDKPFARLFLGSVRKALSKAFSRRELAGLSAASLSPDF